MKGDSSNVLGREGHTAHFSAGEGVEDEEHVAAGVEADQHGEARVGVEGGAEDEGVAGRSAGEEARPEHAAVERVQRVEPAAGGEADEELPEAKYA